MPRAAPGLDIAVNRATPRYSRRERLARVLWTLAWPLWRLSPPPAFGWRRLLLRVFGARVGQGVHVYPSAVIRFPWQLTIGGDSAIGEHALIYNLGPVSIGARVTISQRAHLCAGSHDHRDPRLPLLRPPIHIQDEAWVCADAFVGPGVTVGAGAVVGARAVVVRDVPAWAVLVGNPARQVGERRLRAVAAPVPGSPVGVAPAAVDPAGDRAGDPAADPAEVSGGPAANCSHAYLWPTLRRMLDECGPPSPVGAVPGNAPRGMDLGCGNGWIAARLAGLGFAVAGYDTAQVGIAEARRALPSGHFEVLGVGADPFTVFGGDWDLAVSTEVIEHLYHPRQLLADARALLRPGGLLIVSTPYHGWLKNLALAATGRLDRHFTALWDGGHIKFFSRRTLTALLVEAGFEPVSFRGAGRWPWLWKSMLIAARKPVAPPPGD